MIDTWWASSWAMILVTSFLSATEEVLLSYSSVSSRKVSKPQFSIAPASKSGIATKSGHNRKKVINFSSSRALWLNKNISPIILSLSIRRQWVHFILRNGALLSPARASPTHQLRKTWPNPWSITVSLPLAPRKRHLTPQCAGPTFSYPGPAPCWTTFVFLSFHCSVFAIWIRNFLES